MQAHASTQYRRNPGMAVYPFEFHQRSEPGWRRPRFPSSAQIEHAEAPARRRDQCPRCTTVAAAPLVSAPQPGGDIAHHWKCEACEFHWDTCFRPLLV
jgi:hypothetical protein